MHAVLVALNGFHGLPVETLLVAWDDHRATVRTSGGALQWYAYRSRQAYPWQGAILVELLAGSVLPRETTATARSFAHRTRVSSFAPPVRESKGVAGCSSQPM